MAKVDDVGLLIIRCGRTAWDEAGRFQGSADLPMSDTGRAALLEALQDEQVRALNPGPILAAPDEASVESAGLIAEALGGKVREVAALRGIDFGLWQGLLDGELLERYPTAYQRWRQDPASVNPPEGETFLDVELRVLGALRKAAEKAGPKPLAVVLRPLPYGLVRTWVHGKPTSQLWDLLEDGPSAEYHRIPRGLFRSILESMKAGA